MTFKLARLEHNFHHFSQVNIYQKEKPSKISFYPYQFSHLIPQYFLTSLILLSTKETFISFKLLKLSIVN